VRVFFLLHVVCRRRGVDLGLEWLVDRGLEHKRQRVRPAGDAARVPAEGADAGAPPL